MRKTVSFVFRWLLLYNFFITAAATLLVRLAGLDRYFGMMLAVAAGAGLVYLCTFRKHPVKPFAPGGKKMAFRDLILFLGLIFMSQIAAGVVKLLAEALGIRGIEIDFGRMTDSLAVYAVAVAPFIEELLYRGFAAGNLRRTGTLLSVILSALAFGLMHRNLCQFVFALPVGLVLGYVCSEYSIWWTILLHGINNALGTVQRIFLEANVLLPNLFLSQGIAVLAILGLVNMIRRRRELGEWFSRPGVCPGKEELREAFTAPWLIIYTVFYTSLIIFYMFFPEYLNS